MSYLEDLKNQTKSKSKQAQSQQKVARRTYTIVRGMVVHSVFYDELPLKGPRVPKPAIDPAKYDTIIVKNGGCIEAARIDKNQKVIIEQGGNFEGVILFGATMDVSQCYNKPGELRYELKDIIMLPGSVVYARASLPGKPICQDDYVIDEEPVFSDCKSDVVMYTVRKKTAFDYLRDIVLKECDESIKQAAKMLADGVKTVEELAQNNPS